MLIKISNEEFKIEQNIKEKNYYIEKDNQYKKIIFKNLKMNKENYQNILQQIQNLNEIEICIGEECVKRKCTIYDKIYYKNKFKTYDIELISKI